MLESRPEPVSLPPAEQEVPAPAMRGGLGRVRERMNNVINESVPMIEADGHGGHGDGHGNGHENGHAAQVERSSAPDRPGAEDQDDHS